MRLATLRDGTPDGALVVVSAGNTNGPAMVIGWRAAELILQDRGAG